MSTPTDEQQIRSTLRRRARAEGDGSAARLAIEQAIVVLTGPCVKSAIDALADEYPSLADGDGALPPLMGASEAADVLGMKATNLKRLSPPLPVAAVISGRIPVYREADVRAAKARRDERRRAA